MIIAIPVSFHDVSRLPAFIKALKKFGGLFKHRVVFFPQLSQGQAAKMACAEILPITANSSVEVIPFDFPINNHPQSPNAQFAYVADWIARQGAQCPWLWMELDCRPIKENWADLLEQEYLRSGKPFVGNIVPTPYKPQEEWVTLPDDFMMMGVGMYPANLPELVPLVRDLGIGPRGAPYAFGVYLRQSMMGIGWHDTKLIADKNSTGNYRMENGTLICDHVEGAIPRRPRAGPVNPEAVLIHGCKDDSLDRIIFAESAVTPEPPPAPVIEQPEVVTTSVAENVRVVYSEPVVNPPATMTMPPVVSSAAINPYQAELKWVKKGKHRAKEFQAQFPNTPLTSFLNECGYKVVQGGWLKKGRP